MTASLAEEATGWVFLKETQLLRQPREISVEYKRAFYVSFLSVESLRMAKTET